MVVVDADTTTTTTTTTTSAPEPETRKVALSRSEVLLACGGGRRRLEMARSLWGRATVAAHGALGADPADVLGSCVNGHLCHARCFSSLLSSGSPCPSCKEPLVFPPVESRVPDPQACRCPICNEPRDGEDGHCRRKCELKARERAEDEAEAARVAAAAADPQANVAMPAGGGTGLHSSSMRCPECNFGPIHQDKCGDMNTHHGECMNRNRPTTHPDYCKHKEHWNAQQEGDIERNIKAAADRTIAAQKGGSGGGGSSLMADIAPGLAGVPDCPKCRKAKCQFNGCMRCGINFKHIRNWGQYLKDNPHLVWKNETPEQLARRVGSRRALQDLEKRLQFEEGLLAHEQRAVDILFGQELY